MILKNGDIVRGTLVSIEPNTEVSILLDGAKEPRSIAWADVRELRPGGYSAPEGPSAPGYLPLPPFVPMPLAPPSVGQRGVVRLHIDSPRPVRLHQRTQREGYSYGYGPVAIRSEFSCTSPCDMVIDARDGKPFVLEGDGMPSADLKLADRRGDVTVKVGPGNSALRVLGIVTGTLGGVGILAGANVAVLIPGFGSDAPQTGGIVAITLGSVALIGGFAMVAAGETTAEVESRPTPKRPGTPAASPKKSAARAPRYWLGEF